MESRYPHRKTNKNCSQVPPSPCFLWPDPGLCIAEYLIARSKRVVGSQGVDLAKSVCIASENSDLRHTGVMKKDVLLNTRVNRGQEMPENAVTNGDDLFNLATLCLAWLRMMRATQ